MSDHEQWRPRVNPWFIAAAVMLPTFMEVLDTSIASVALPYIGGNLGATPSEATWVLTSYLVSNAIVLPASGWLSRYFGRKRLLITCIIIFPVDGWRVYCALALRGTCSVFRERPRCGALFWGRAAARCH